MWKPGRNDSLIIIEDADIGKPVFINWRWRINHLFRYSWFI